MERWIDFSRDRRMLCGICGDQWVVDLGWTERWEQGREKCPGCGTNCESEDSPHVTVDPGDPVLDDDLVARFFWYHSSTQPDWPARDFDPAAVLTPETRRMMGGEQRVAAWAASQHSKALHVGTYEAAVHNMLRRMRDQADRGSQFYLYRVRLKSSLAVREGWLVDPSNFVGDVMLKEVCPPGVDVARYLNYHEDPGGLSLALGRDAITSVQRVAIPLADPWDQDWVRNAVAALDGASDTVAPASGRLGRFIWRSSPRAVLARKLVAVLADDLPADLRNQFVSAAAFTEGDDTEQWARGTRALVDLVVDPARARVLLDRQERREV